MSKKYRQLFIQPPISGSVILSLRYVEDIATWKLFDAEEQEVGTVCDWVAEKLGATDLDAEYMMALEAEKMEE